MNWEKLKSNYPHFHEAFKNFIEQQPLDLKKPSSRWIKKFLKKEGYRVPLFYTYALKEFELRERTKSDPRLIGLPLHIKKKDLISTAKDLNLNQIYKVRIYGHKFSHITATYVGIIQKKSATKKEIHGFKGPARVRLVFTDQLSFRVFKNK